MVRRALLEGLAVSLVTVLTLGCRGDSGMRDGLPKVAAHADAPAAPGVGPARLPRRSEGCPVTPPNHAIPPGQAGNPGATAAPYYGDGRLWTGLEKDGVVAAAPDRDGSIGEKFPWWRGVRGRLRITGRRLDGAAPTLRAQIPDGYGPTGFQSSGIIFPTAGCWRVTGMAASASLSF